jgi:hypothetical protein
VNEISSDARSDEIPREGNKGKRDGMLHTRLLRKQRKMQVVDDEIGLNGQGGGKRGIDIQLATAETALSFHHYIPARNRTKNKQAVLSYMGKNITKNENPHEPTSWR